MADDEFRFDWNKFCASDGDSERHSSGTFSIRPNDWAETMKQCEFIELVDEKSSFKLRMSETFRSRWEQVHEYSDDLESSLPKTENPISPDLFSNDVFVVSLLGDTASGKSFLADHLLPQDVNLRPLVIDEDQRTTSTTANVTLFESVAFFPESDQINLLLLDYEGEKGSRLPLALNLTNESCSEEKAEQRRKAVSTYFPKLAYIISNVIILISREDFCHSDYVKRCYDFAVRATDGLQHNLYKPVLILVQNFYAVGQIKSIMDLTRQFFHTHDGEVKKLEQFFEAVYCVRLPCKRPETCAPMITTADRHPIFSQHTDHLVKLLRTICNDQRPERIIPRMSWLDTVKLVVDVLRQDRTVMMHMLLRQVLISDPGDKERNTVMYLFSALYKKCEIHSIRWFQFCRRFAISVFARSIAVRLMKEMKYIPENNLKHIAIREECRVCLNKLWQWLDEFQPCAALYMGDGYVKEKDRPVFCFQHKGAHREHRTSEVVHDVSLWSVGSLKIRRLWRIHDVWSGEFQSDSSTVTSPTKEMHEMFYDEVNEFVQAIKSSDDGLYLTLVRLLKQYDLQVPLPIIYWGACCFCLRETKLKRLNPALYGHDWFAPSMNYVNKMICDDCQRKAVALRQNHVDQLPIPRRNIEECAVCMKATRLVRLKPCDHTLLCQPCLDPINEKYHRCPACKKMITQTI